MKQLFTFSLVLVSLTSCAERTLDGLDGPESELLPVCMLYPAGGYEHEGKQGDRDMLRDPDGATGRTCDCLTHEEFEQGLRLDEFNDRALQECLQLAAPYTSNDCQELHDEGEWLSLMLPAVGDQAWLTDGKDLDCSEQVAAQGCSATSDSSPPLGLLALVFLGLARRRRCTPGEFASTSTHASSS